MKAALARVEYIEAASSAALQTAVHTFLEGLGESELIEPIPDMVYDGTNYIQPIWYLEGS
jgi:hypothetical protein